MFITRLAAITLTFALTPAIGFSQQSIASQSSTTPDPANLLRASLASILGNTTTSDVTLSGTARRIAGSDDDTGTAVFKALVSGAARTDFTLSSGQYSEVSDPFAAGPAGAWSGPDRVSHPVAIHNLLSEPAWFFPAFAVARRLSNTGYVTTYVGHETHNNQAVEHISVIQTSPDASASFASLYQHLTQVDFFLDSTTLLPIAISFNIHPDNDASLDIPIEIRFSDYRAVNGAQVPYHIQKFLNNTLLLDFQAQTAALNTGLAASAFSGQ